MGNLRMATSDTRALSVEDATSLMINGTGRSPPSPAAAAQFRLQTSTQLRNTHIHTRVPDAPVMADERYDCACRHMMILQDCKINVSDIDVFTFKFTNNHFHSYYLNLVFTVGCH